MSAKVLKRKHFQIENRMEATGIHLPEQIVEEILSRLPLRSLLRFKCVSKIWEALISDPYFHKMMMHQSPDSNSQKLLIRKMFGDTAPSRFKFYSSSLSTFEDVQQLDPPLTHYVGRYHIFSSFDGLVLLAADTQLFLWNPLTRETVLLPYTEYNIIYTSFGLGYDDATDGYKILKLNMRLKHSMEILNLKTGFWREICNHPTAVCPRTGYEMELFPLPSKHIPMEPLVYVHGAFHWIGDLMVPGKFYVVSFSISNEVYGDVPLLDEMGKKKFPPPRFWPFIIGWNAMLLYH
ncbi:F-box/kelch-repeat protein At3g06240-like [Capsicum annuum]|uniref:F-box/kelch-repeat protein At3g06240-like n=1 Tax=Capsicum annuum TaxID=4072 RepID=UPI001FB0536D|nr:F-box/kelch-repeat protein At3g06240-like [Capsicum annuum]